MEGDDMEPMNGMGALDDPEGLNAYFDSIPKEDESNVFSFPPRQHRRAPAQAVAEEDDGELPGCVDPGEWIGKSAPDRKFIIPGWLVRGHAGLLSGMEGVGKSLIAQQMATCIALGRPFLGLDVEQERAVYVTCEDSKAELWRRQEAINKSLGVTMADLSGKLKLVSIVGELGNELGTFGPDGALTPSARYRQIAKVCLEFSAGFLVLDNAAHLFAGNENARHDVAAFLGLIERLSQQMNGAALLLAHPNKQLSQGNKQGNEYSGSTGWSAHVRNRLFIDYREVPEDGTPVDDDDRVLRKSKANYGKRGEEIYFRWHDWAFVRPADLPEDTARDLEATSRAHHENERFLACLDSATEERRAVSASSAAANYAPRVFEKMPTAKGMKKEAFEAALNRLLGLKVIANDQPVYKRENRSWATGIGRAEKCTNPRTNHAQSDAQSVHTPPHKPATNPHPGRTPSTTYLGEPLGRSPTKYDGEPKADPPDQHQIHHRTKRRPGLTRSE
jgi:RecA-family ATPase